MHRTQYSRISISFICVLSRCSSRDIIGGPLGDRLEGNTSFGFQFWERLPLPCFCPMLICFGPNIISSHRNCIASAFSAILVFAQELMPGKVGMISGLFFGFAFGMGGLGSALLGISG
jgi:FSR family fosmidomycin resistance protein-like MFS transporter